MTTALGFAPRTITTVDSWVSAISTGAILAVAGMVLALTAQALSTPEVYVSPIDWHGEGVLRGRIGADVEGDIVAPLAAPVQPSRG